MRISLLTIATTLIGCFTSSVATAAYPERPITIIVNFGAGGGTDMVVRAAAPIAEKILGQPIVVINRPGAGGTIGPGAVAAANPDGYTIGVVTSAGLTVAPHVVPIAFKPLESFEFIGGIAKYVYGTSVPASSPFKTLKDLIEYARANPGKINYGVQGLSTTNNIAMVRLSKAAGIQMTPITFKGTTDEVVAALGGHIDVTNQDPPVTVPHIQAGKLRLLASFSDQRWKWAPEVPTVKELGYDFSVGALLGLVAPRGTPEPVMAALRIAFRKVAESDEYQKAVDKIFLVPQFTDHTQWRKDTEIGLKENEALIRELGLYKKE